MHIKEEVLSLAAAGETVEREQTELDTVKKILADLRSKSIAQKKGNSETYSINDYEDEQCYIPSSANCAMKCLFFLKLVAKIDPKELKNATFRSLQTRIKGQESQVQLLSITKRDKKAGVMEQIRRVDHKTLTIGQQSILLIEKYSHYTVIKQGWQSIDQLYEIKRQIEGLIGDMQALLPQEQTHLFDAKDIQGRAVPKTMTFNHKVVNFNGEDVKQTILNHIFFWDVETYDESHLRYNKKVILKLPYSAQTVMCRELDVANKTNLRFTDITVGEDCIIVSLNKVIAQMLKVIEFQDKYNTSNPKSQFYPAFYMFAHNGAAYDYKYIVQVLDKLSHPAKPYKLFKSGKRLCFDVQLTIANRSVLLKLRDTCMFLSPQSLTNLCQGFKVPSDICKTDYAITSVTKENWREVVEDPLWQKYALNDCLSLEFIVKAFKTAFNQFQTSKKVSSFDVLTKRTSSMIANTYLQRRSKVAPAYTQQVSTKTYVQQFIRGGRVDFSRSYTCGDLVCIDANSLYPSAMSTLEYMPSYEGVSQVDPRQFRQQVIDNPTLLLDHPYLVLCDIYIPREVCYVVCSTEHLDEKGDLKSVEQRTGYCYQQHMCSIDLHQLITCNKAVLLEVHRADKLGKDENYLKQTIDELYEERLKAKADKNVALSEVLKSMLNSAYGKFAQKEILRDFYLIDRPFDQLTQRQIIQLKKVTEKTLQFHRLNDRDCIISSEHSIDDHKNNVYNNLNAVFILAQSRKLMNDAIALMDGFFNDVVLYTDTDSITTFRHNIEKVASLLSETELGKFKVEKEFTSMWVTGKKQRMMLDKNDHYTITFKGVSRLHDFEKDISYKLTVPEFQQLYETGKMQVVCEQIVDNCNGPIHPSQMYTLKDIREQRYKKKGLDNTLLYKHMSIDSQQIEFNRC